MPVFKVETLTTIRAAPCSSFSVLRQGPGRPLDIFPPEVSPSRTTPRPFLHGLGHSPTTTIRQSTIKSDIPLSCTKLTEVERLG